jgi:hypothetical protein
MMGAGTGAQLYGTNQRDRAQRQALQDYEDAVNARAGAERRAMVQEQGVLSGLAQERQGGVGNYIQELSNASRGLDPRQFQQSNRGVLTDISQMTGGQQSQYAYQGSPRTQAESQQATMTGQSNARLAEAMLADHAARQIAERQQMSQHKLSLADLLRQGRGKTAKERFDLAKALRDLDWQKKTQALQSQLDEAGRKGQWLNTLGGLSTQVGGMAMMAGMAPGAEAGAATPGASTEFLNANPGSLDMLSRPMPLNPMV